MQAKRRPKDAAPLDPSRDYATPQALYEDVALSTERKIVLLRQWEYDLRSIQVAAEENMTSAASASSGANAELLREVRRCLRALCDAPDDHSPTNKHGGVSVDN